MKVNIISLNGVLSGMIEAQYWGEIPIEDYLDFIEHQQETMKLHWDNDSREEYRQELKTALKAILNNPSLDYDEIFFQGAMHGLGSQDRAKQLFELIWHSFFGDEDWHDVVFSSEEVILVCEPSGEVIART
jgi:hypothetical protein